MARTVFYTVSKIRLKSDDLYGPVHASDDGYVTVCGVEIARNGKWYIVTNSFDGIVTCCKCNRILESCEN